MEVIATPYKRTQTPKQKLFWAFYINRSLDTFGNAYKCAILVGYKDSTARNITMKVWFQNGEDFYGELLRKAEENISEILDLEMEENVYYKGKKIGKRFNAKIGRIKLEMTKFVCLTIGKRIYNYKPYEEPRLPPSPVEYNPELQNLFKSEIHKCPNCKHEF
jgi:hypothetical protein